MFVNSFIQPNSNRPSSDGVEGAGGYHGEDHDPLEGVHPDALVDPAAQGQKPVRERGTLRSPPVGRTDLPFPRYLLCEQGARSREHPCRRAEILD